MKKLILLSLSSCSAPLNKLQPTYCMVLPENKIEVGTVLERGLLLKAIGTFSAEKCFAKDGSDLEREMSCEIW